MSLIPVGEAVRSFALKALAVILALSCLIYGPKAFAALVAGNVGSNSVTLTWMSQGDDGALGTASQYDIRYSTSPITNSNWGTSTSVLNPPLPRPAGTQESFVVQGLTPNTTYYFAIKAADEVPNWSPMSNVILVSTAAGDTIPPAGVFDLD